jgi:hypothetical protein
VGPAGLEPDRPFSFTLIKSINGLDLTNEDIVRAANPILTELADADENNLVRASAITALGKLKNPANLNLFKLL